MVYVHIASGFEEIETTTIVDILRRGGVDTEIVSIEGKNVKGAHDIELTADITFEEADYENCEMIVMPGGMPGTANLQAHEGLSARIGEFNDAGKWICAMCAAPMIFGGMGILEGRKATIYPGMEEYLTGALKSIASVVKDEHIITSKAPGTAMLFALELLGALKGEKVMEEVKSELFMAI